MVAAPPVLEIGNRPPPLRDLLRDLWRHRRLMGMLARRDFFVRYRRASFGLLWAVIVPLSQALVLAAVLGRIARISTPGVPLTVFILSGMVAWTFFNSAVSGATTSIVDGAGMSTKIYFPRAVLPLVTVVAGLFGLALNLAVLLVLTPIYGSWPGWRLLLLPAAVALAASLAAAFGLVLSAVQVYFRDVRYLLDAAQRAWFYLTPVFYPITMVESLRPYIEANPATGMVELLRAATVGAEDGWITSLYWSLGWLAVLVAIGLYLHRRYDRLFADLM
jgi:lipopolysaccharide transport system permease protein